MRILLDECTPSIVKTLLPHRDIQTVQEMGWSGVKNGALLTSAEEQFDILVTTDKNLRYQQNLAGFELAVVLLPSNQVPVVVRLISAIDEALDTARVKDFIEIRPVS